MAEDFSRCNSSAVADDGSKSTLQREAIALSRRAEFLVEVDGQPDEAVEVANQCLDAFKALGDAEGITDALRLVFEAQRQKADALKWKDDDDVDGQAKDIHKLIESLATKHLNSAITSGDKRMQGAMLLSLAETNYERRGTNKREEAFKSANAAVALLQQLGDAKLHGLSLLNLSRIYCKNHDVPAAISSANEGIVAFQSINDSAGESHCWHCIAVAQLQVFRLADAVESGRKAVAVGKASGNTFLYARQACCLGDWYIRKDDYSSALPLLKEAYQLFSEMGNSKGWQTGALEHYVTALVHSRYSSEAVKVGKQAVKAFKKAGKKKDQVYAMVCLAAAYVSDSDHDMADDAFEKAIEVAQEIKDRLLEVEVAKAAAENYVSCKRFDDALHMAERVKELYKDLGRTKEEAFALMHEITKVHVLANNSKKSLNSADEALKLVENIGDASMEAHALLANAVVFACSDDLEKALKCVEEAAELFQEDGNKAGQAKAYLQSSQIHIAKNDFKVALREASDSLEMQEALGDRSAQSEILRMMGEIHISCDRPKEALALFSDGAKIAREVEDYEKVYRNLLGMTEAYGSIIAKSEAGGTIAKENAGFAIKTAKEAAKLAEVGGDMDSEARAHYWLAALSLVLGKISDMFQAAYNTISLAKQAGNQSFELKGMCELAKAWIAKGKLAKATGVLEDAHDIAKKIGDSDMEREIADLLKDIESRASVMVVASTSDQAMVAAPAETTPVETEVPKIGSAVKAYVAPNPGIISERIISMVLDMTGSSDSVEQDTPFMDSGIDSLASVELRTNLQQQFGVPLPSTVMFNFPTTASITNFLVSEMTEREIPLK